MTKEDIIKLPKVELHCHLDGSLSQGFVEKRLGRPVGKEELSVSDDCTSLAEYLEKFDLPGQCLRDEEGLEEAGYDVLRSMKQENVIYSEIRFAPLLSETEDMNCNKVIEAVLKGLERGKRFRNRVWSDRMCDAASQRRNELAHDTYSERISWLRSVCSRSCRSRSYLPYVRV